MFEVTKGRRGMGLLTLALALLTSSAAQAEPSDADKHAARELMTRGRAEREAGNLQGALESFARAHAIMHVPTTLLEMVRTQEALGQWLEALTLVRELRSVAVPGDEPMPFARARGEAEELARKLEMRMPTLHLDLSGSPQPETTSVAIDGAPRADCTQACWVNPGKHLVVARSPTAQAEEQVAVAEGETAKLELVFSPDVPDPRKVRQIGDEQAHPVARPEQSHLRNVPLSVWILGGVAVAGAGAGVVLGRSAVNEHDSLRATCAPRCSTDQIEGVRQRALAANLSFGVGAAAAAAAVVTYLFRPVAPKSVSTGSASAPPLKRLSVWGAPTPAGGYMALQADF